MKKRTDPLVQARELDVNRQAAKVVAQWMRTDAYTKSIGEGWALDARSKIHAHACRRLYGGLDPYATVTCEDDLAKLST